MQYILASASPRRKELMQLITEDFIILPANIDEAVTANIPPHFTPEYLAVKKAEFVAKQHPNSLVIGSDTGVFLNSTMFGKPQNNAEAEQMLKGLSGKTHSVITGCALFYKGKHLSFSEETKVEFLNLTDTQISDYVNTGECLDKAGAYAIQGKGALLVKGINGDYFNVVGLPVSRLKREIETFFKLFGEKYE